MSETYFSRLTFKRNDAALTPLLAALVPRDGGAAMAMNHRLMWSVMPEDMREKHEKGASAFLWREAEKGRLFYMLGPRPVQDSPFFQIETKIWRLELEAGDRLSFDMRVNATVDRKIGVDAMGRARRQRCDVVMDLLGSWRRDGKGEAADIRQDAAQEAAGAWLRAQGDRYGFSVPALNLEAYRVEHFARGNGAAATIGVLELKGILDIVDPAAFGARVRAGFGRAKAFGCGLMLLRRAR